MTSGLSVELEKLLKQARKHNLGLAMATQNFTDSIPREVKTAAINNARTQVVFRVAKDEARVWAAEFERHIDEEDIKGLPPYEALARVASSTGLTSLSMRTLKPVRPTGTQRQVVDASRAKYGRPIADVEAERDSRRTSRQDSNAKRPTINPGEWRK